MRVLERIAGRDEPPHAVETKPPHRQQTGRAMRRMRRIEGAAEQADAHAARVRRQDDAAKIGGRGHWHDRLRDRLAARRPRAQEGTRNSWPLKRNPLPAPAGLTVCFGDVGGKSWPRLPAAAYAIFETGELLDPDRAARMHPPGGDADLGAEAELAAVGELRRGIVQHDRRIDFAQEFLAPSSCPRSRSHRCGASRSARYARSRHRRRRPRRRSRWRRDIRCSSRPRSPA